MKVKDRRMGTERREDERLNVALDIEWASGEDVRPGRLSDLSPNGCFILTQGEFGDGEVVRIYFPSSSGSRIELLGEIRNHVPDMGFAVKFVHLTDTQRAFIQSFAELHQST